jgi:hypothetical protein
MSILPQSGKKRLIAKSFMPWLYGTNTATEDANDAAEAAAKKIADDAKAAEQARRDALNVPPPLKSTSVAGSEAILAARMAAERQRKRAAGGGLPVGTQPAGPKASLTPKTLVGS